MSCDIIRFPGNFQPLKPAEIKPERQTILQLLRKSVAFEASDETTKQAVLQEAREDAASLQHEYRCHALSAHVAMMRKSDGINRTITALRYEIVELERLLGLTRE